MMRKISRYIITYLVTLFALVTLLAATACIPNSQIYQGMADSAEYFSSNENFRRTSGKRIDSIQDNYADSILLNVMWHVDSKDPVRTVIDTGYYDTEAANPTKSLKEAVKNNLPANVNYTRYWHGSVIWLRPLLVFTDVVGARHIVFGVICVLLLALCLMLVYRRQYLAAVSLLLSMCGIQFWKLSLALEYQPAFLVALIMCILFVHYESKGDNPLVVLSVISGVAVSFTDFLTTEIVTILLPLLIIMTIRATGQRIRTFKQEMIFAGQCLLAWGISYIITFVAKWTVASIVTGTSQFGMALSSVEERVAGTDGGETLPLLNQIFGAPLSNISTLFMGHEYRLDYGSIIVGLILALMVLGSIFYLFRTDSCQKTLALVCLVIGLLPYVRYMVLNNHSYLHVFFTYRAQCITIYALVAMIGSNVSLDIIRGSKGRRR